MDQSLEERLWAPWRLAYVTDPKKPKNPADCFICAAVSLTTIEQDREALVLHRTAHSIAILNRFPYNNGHTLVCPRAHKADLAELTSEELLDGLELIRTIVAAMRQLMNPHGFNIGLNMGHAAGAGVPGHLHWHIVPRWNGDVNFMPTIASTKVLPQSLDALWELMTLQLRNVRS